MKILGSKFFGQDSAIFYLDTDKKEIFAINSDRISRIKKDNYDISPILDNYAYLLGNLDEVSYPFSNFQGNDVLLETKGTSYYWLKWQHLLRRITKPKFRSDLLRKKTPKEKFLIFLKSLLSPKIFYYKVMRDYYWRKYRNNSLTKNFHSTKIDKYIKETLLRYKIPTKQISYFDHHLCHATSAYYFSPFAYTDKALVFTLDEHGDECFSKVFLFNKNSYKELTKSTTSKFFQDDQGFVTSIAGMYSNFTEAMGLIRSTDEGKVEALAAYGTVNQNIYNQLMDMVKIEDLQYKINLKKFKKFSDQLYLSELKKEIGEKDFCATIQFWLNDVVVKYLNKVHKKYKIENLCLAGGAVANIIMNYNIYKRTPFKRIFIVPPMGDEGSAVGAGILSALNAKKELKWLKNRIMPYFGPAYSKRDVLNTIKQFNNFQYAYLGDDWYFQAAKAISMNKIIAVFQGRMEFGPRALGNRSILANAADKTIRDKLNFSIKRRPWYQPFCPSILEEDREKLFEKSFKHKHMATAFLMKKKFWNKFSSAIHIDGTARPQFVEKNDNPNFYKLLKELKKLIGFGIVINTSYNLHGRTIVNTPRDAIVDFKDCNIDELYIEGYRLIKNKKKAE